MGTKNHSSSAADPKKRRRVGFSTIDAGVEANDCIKIYLVSSKEEVDSENGFSIQPVDLNHFFNEEGKIYGYQGLKINIWISSITFHAYADISFQSKRDGGKGITDLKSALQDILAENLVESKDDFIQTFSKEDDILRSIIPKGEIFPIKSLDKQISDSNNHPKTDYADFEVIRFMGTMPVGHLYSRLVPLVLLLVDGSNPIDITDPGWEIVLIIQKQINQEENYPKILGFAAIYRFYRYPNNLRLRLGQILVLPPYQNRGYGRCLTEVLNDIAVCENVYDLTVEEPSDSLQHVRTCIDVQRLISFDPIKQALDSTILRLKQENLSKKTRTCSFRPPPGVIEDVRKNFKINKKQFLLCWEALIYIGLDPIEEYMDNYRTIVSDRIRADVMGNNSGTEGKQVVEIPTEYDQDMSFVMFRTKNGEAKPIEMAENQVDPEQQLKQLVDERLKEMELIAEKVKVKL